MKKIVIVSFVIFLLVGVFCFPINIGKKLEKLQQSPHVSIVYSYFAVDDEKDPIKYEDCSIDVSSKEYEDIVELLKEYNAYRGYDTFFPEGNGIEGPGRTIGVNLITITDTNKLFVDGRIYYLSYFDKNSGEEIVNQLLEILKK